MKYITKYSSPKIDSIYNNPQMNSDLNRKQFQIKLCDGYLNCWVFILNPISANGRYCLSTERLFIANVTIFSSFSRIFNNVYNKYEW